MAKNNGLFPTQKDSLILKLLLFIQSSSDLNIGLVSVFIVLTSFALSFFTGITDIFSASGGVLTVLGIFVLVGVSTPVSFEDIDQAVKEEVSNPCSKTSATGEEVIQHIATIVQRILHNRSRQVLGTKISAIGILIWAYGWLIEKLPSYPVGACICT